MAIFVLILGMERADFSICFLYFWNDPFGAFAIQRFKNDSISCGRGGYTRSVLCFVLNVFDYLELLCLLLLRLLDWAQWN